MGLGQGGRDGLWLGERGARARGERHHVELGQGERGARARGER